MLIAEVSAKYDLSADTLRYYERIGLIPQVHRNKSGIRDYTGEDCRWVEFIKCMRAAGLPIEVLIDYVAMFQQGDSTITERKEIIEKVWSKQKNAPKPEELQVDHLIYGYPAKPYSKITIWL